MIVTLDFGKWDLGSGSGIECRHYKKEAFPTPFGGPGDGTRVAVPGQTQWAPPLALHRIGLARADSKSAHTTRCVEWRCDAGRPGRAVRHVRNCRDAASYGRRRHRRRHLRRRRAAVCVLLSCSEGGGFSFVKAAVGTLSSGAVRLFSAASAWVPCRVSRVLGGNGRWHCIATWRIVATSHWIETWRAATLYCSMSGCNRPGRSRRNSPSSLSTSLRTTPSSQR
jgi:hypothetical protein